MTSWNELDSARPLLTPAEVAAAIHSTPHKMVMAFAGAGVQTLAWLHGVGGSSRTVLTAVDIYSPNSMRNWVGFMPARFTSRRVARAMARRAHAHALKLVEGDDAVFGVGSTATIATDRAKLGDHRVAAAAHDAFGTVTYFLTMEKDSRDRAGEEELVSLLLLKAAADACGVLASPDLPLMGAEELDITFEPSSLYAALAEGAEEVVTLRKDGTLSSKRASQPKLIVSGAFNPVHRGHLELAAAGARFTGLPPLFELPLINADKAPIGLTEARRRAQQFVGHGDVALTRTPLFVQKARLFPGSVFAIGMDTAERLLEPRFYTGSEGAMISALQEVGQLGSSFLVAGRRASTGAQDSARFRTLSELAVPEPLTNLFAELPEGEFRKDISSTDIRTMWRRRRLGAD